MKNIYKRIGISFLFSFCILAINESKANVIVVPASGGACVNLAPSGYSALGTMKIYEGVRSDFATQTGTTLILTAPANLEFNPASGNVSFTAGRNITSASISVTTSTITVTLSVSGTNRFDSLFISNIQARGILGGASGNIQRLAAGGTAVIAGDTPGGGVNHGSLNSTAGAATISSVSSGNWSNPATWAGGVVPASCGASVVISHAVTVDIPENINNLTIDNGGHLTANNPVIINGTFTLNNGGTYTHNNTADVSQTIFAGIESFASNSTINVKSWYDYNVPLAAYVNGNFGNVVFDAGGTWDQDGMFAPAKLQGTLSVLSGTIRMDDGTGSTTSLTTKDVSISGTGNILFQTGFNRNLTLVTGNFTDNSSSASITSIMYQSTGTLNWTCNGNVNISHDFSAQQGTGSEPGNSVVQISGDLTIGGGRFNFNRSLNGSLNLTVSGSTTINGNPTWVRFIDTGSGNLNYTTGNLYINGGANNTLMGGSNPTGAAEITISNDVTMSGSATTFFFLSSNLNSQDLNVSVGRDLIVNGGNFRSASSAGNAIFNIGRNLTVNGSTSNFSGQRNTLNIASTVINVSGNISVTNGAFTGSLGYGDINMQISQDLNATNATFLGISNNTVGKNGIGTYSMGSLNYNGGSLIFHDTYVTSGATVQVNCNGNFVMNFSNGSDRVTLINKTGVNNASLDFTVGGNLTSTSSASGARFLSSGAGNETVTINGSMSIAGATLFFNGLNTPVGNPHDITTHILGNVTVTGGSVYYSTLGGSANITVGGNYNVNGGTTIVKWDTGTATLTINGNYTHSSGMFYLHSNNQPTPDAVEMIVNNDFSQTGGTIHFDAYTGNGNPSQVITLNGSNYTLGGSGIMTHANHLTANTASGSIIFNRAGTINYNRQTNSHDIRQVKQFIMTGCVLNVSASVREMQIASHQSSIPADHNALTVYGTINLGTRQISARQQAGYYSQVTLASGSRLRTQHTGGLYSGSATASCINSMISGSNTMNYFLDPLSTVEYNGTSNQVVTGIPNGIATGNQHKYGNLEINFTGTPDVNYVYPETSNEVFIRSGLILSNGEFNLDNDKNAANGGGRTITLENGATISRTNGYVRSEVQDGSGIVRWNISGTGSFIFPFGYNSSSFIPFTYTPTSGSSGDVSMATYHTAINNTSYPPGVLHVRDMSGVDNSSNTVDRFWYLTVAGNPVVDLTFSATAAEVGSINNPRAQRWLPANNGWEAAQGTQSNPTGTSTLASGITGTGVWWTLSSSNNPLPVELLSFVAGCHNNSVMLKWSTASEVNNMQFEVERSADKISFETIQTVQGAGNSNTVNNYEAHDPNPLPGTSWYRLKQTDFNGAIHYSKILSVTTCKKYQQVQITQLSNSGHVLFVHAISEVSLPVMLNIMDVSGKNILSQHGMLQADSNVLEINHSLPAGLYMVRLAWEQGQATGKLFIEK